MLELIVMFFGFADTPINIGGECIPSDTPVDVSGG